MSSCLRFTADRSLALRGLVSGTSRFFFSSRRRHTIYIGDWSSDVCSSDLGDQFFAEPGYPRVRLWPDAVHALYGSSTDLPRLTPTWDKRYLDLADQFEPLVLPLARSEERRVGEECRLRGVTGSELECSMR